MAAKKTKKARKSGHKKSSHHKVAAAKCPPCPPKHGSHKRSSHQGKKASRKAKRKAKRNDWSMVSAMGESTGMRWLKFFGAAAAGIGIGVLSTLLLARTALEAQTQDLILGVGGIALGSALMAFGVPVLGASMLVGTATVAASRATVRMSAEMLRQSVVDQARAIAAQATGASAPAPSSASAPATTNPGGYPTGWNQLPSGGGNLGQQWSSASISLQPAMSGLG